MAVRFPELRWETSYQQSPQGTEVPHTALVAHGTAAWYSANSQKSAATR
ncbi:rCG61428, isoform CRA_b [Rattus norvegicus]|uniref:RCG61428, isoform CRA_b n=1 Tax=Rattus norvegicus TaxID=10116 RepID=A6HB21_RAT|nr:rCG61428, isoform CRA_b [Rattus norvegicus]